MSRPSYRIPRLIAVLILLALPACGYRHPAADDDRPVAIYHEMWENRTAEFGLESTLFQELTAWFLKNPMIVISESPQGADYILKGTVLSFQQPASAFAAHDRAVELRGILQVSLTLSDAKTGETIWQTPGYSRSEVFTVEADAFRTRDRKTVILERMSGEIAEDVYYRIATVRRLPYKNKSAMPAGH